MNLRTADSVPGRSSGIIACSLGCVKRLGLCAAWVLEAPAGIENRDRPVLIADQSASFAEQRGRKNMKKFVIAAILAAWGAGFAAQAQLKEHPIPRLVKSDGRYALLVDGAPYLMLGAQANNSSDWPATLPKVWSAIEFLHANTLEIPIYWEQFEPKQGQFD
jgi:hypothetical protein